MPGDSLPPAPDARREHDELRPAGVAAADAARHHTAVARRLLFGNLLIMPIEQSLLYVRPVYVQAAGENNPPLLRKVIVEFRDQVHVGGHAASRR